MIHTADKPTLWRRCIALLRLTLMVIVTLIVAISLAVLRLVLKPFRQAVSRVRIWHFNVWARLMVAMLNGKTRIHGEPPSGRFFLVSNHLGYLDIVVLAQHLPAVFVSKADVKRWPLIGWLTRLADTLYINRERHADIPRTNQSIHDTLMRGDSVVLFPEGTSSNSDWVLPIRPPLLQIAVDQQLPVRTVALHFETRTGDPHAHDAICYYGEMEFAQHVWRLLHVSGFTITIRFGSESHQADDRKTLALSVRREILALQAHNHPSEPSPDSDADYRHYGRLAE